MAEAGAFSKFLESLNEAEAPAPSRKRARSKPAGEKIARRSTTSGAATKKRSAKKK